MTTITSIQQIFIFIPIIGLLISLMIPGSNERLISRVAFFTVGLHMLSAFAFVAAWMMNGMQVLNLKEISLFKSPGYEFLIDFCFDKISAVYLLVGSILTFMVTTYSRYYLHRESGYK